MFKTVQIYKKKWIETKDEDINESNIEQIKTQKLTWK